jgi:hypothetical protein
LNVVLASAHRFPDHARLWYRIVARDLVPALRAVGAKVEVVLFGDASSGFDPRHFSGATLLTPALDALDVVAFRERALERPSDVLFVLDADIFVLDAVWVADFLGHFDDPTVAGVSLLRRGALPGAFALMARSEVYRALKPPVLAPAREGLNRWPHTTKRQPGDRAAAALRARGKKVVDVTPAEAAMRLVDFSGATAVRAARELYGAFLGARFEALLADDPAFAEGAYDNILLGALFGIVFGAPFATPAPPNPAQHLAGSATPEALRAALSGIRDPKVLERLVASFEASDRVITRLAAREGQTFGALCVPAVLPRARVLELRARAAAKRLFGKK